MEERHLLLRRVGRLFAETADEGVLVVPLVQLDPPLRLAPLRLGEVGGRRDEARGREASGAIGSSGVLADQLVVRFAWPVEGAAAANVVHPTEDRQVERRRRAVGEWPAVKLCELVPREGDTADAAVRVAQRQRLLLAQQQRHQSVSLVEAAPACLCTRDVAGEAHECKVEATERLRHALVGKRPARDGRAGHQPERHEDGQREKEEAEVPAEIQAAGPRVHGPRVHVSCLL
mmetsp:Transcript_33684/g.111418  ORF Transcript_33684/g.111418 Transcript_33684/m.111418 type:complete len:232 (+) Transcript_33684:444-1139(+)